MGLVGWAVPRAVPLLPAIAVSIPSCWNASNAGSDFNHQNDAYHGGGDVTQTPDYLSRRFLQSRAARGRGFANPPDTGDRVVCQDEFLAWRESAFPHARGDASRTIFYASCAELVERTTEYAAAIKAAAPQALVFGPVSCGWQGYLNLRYAPDAGGRDFLDAYLEAMRPAFARCGPFWPDHRWA